MMRKHRSPMRLLLLALAISLLASCLSLATAAATPADNATGDTGIVTVLVILLVVLLVCIVLLISLTQWVRVRYRKACKKIRALEAELAQYKQQAADTQANKETPPFVEAAEDTARSSVGVARNQEPESKQTEKTEDTDQPADNASNAAPAEGTEKTEMTEEAETAEKTETAEEAKAVKEAEETKETEKPKQKTKKAVAPVIIPVTDDKEEEEEEPTEEDPADSVRTAAAASTLSAIYAREGEMATTLVTSDGRRIVIKYRHSFRSRMIQADEESKTYYADMKNYLLSYEKVSAADSQNYESFSVGRQQIAKLNISGKTLILYLALDPEKLDGSKYKFENVGDRKRFEKTPLKIKIRSARSQKWAKELIDMTMQENGIAQGEAKNEDYAMPYEDKAALISRGLIQVLAHDEESGEKIDEATILALLAAGAMVEGESAVAEDADVLPLPEEAAAEYVPHVETVTVEEASELLDNEIAVHHLYHRLHSTHKGKQVIINVDTLDASFAAGETVTLERLREMKLVPASAGRLKVLARGLLSKPLRVEADDFSMDALKMILVTGGTPVELD